MVESPDAHGYRLTPMGKRVFLHLFDVQKFIDTISTAHVRLREELEPASATSGAG